MWRAKAARIVRGWGAKCILDLATGSGDLALAIRRKVPDSLVVGADFCHPMLLEAQRKGCVQLVNGDGTRLPFRDGVFDAATVAFGLRNMESREAALAEMARVLRPGGHGLVMDFSLPTSPLFREAYRFYLHRILPVIAGVFTGNRGAYDYLGESIEAFPRGGGMLRLMDDCGFRDPVALPLWGGIVSIYTAERTDTGWSEKPQPTRPRP